MSDTLTISLLGGDGSASDANGTLSSSDNSGATTFTKVSSGVYSFSVTDPASETAANTDTLNAQLHNLIFTPSGQGTTTLSVHVTDKYAGEESTDNTTTITASGGTTLTTPTTPDTIAASSDSGATAPATPQFIATPTATTGTPTATTSGSNTVLDASDGRSFLIGRTADGSLIIDGQDAASSGWSAISGIKSGDSITILGVSKDDFSIGRVSGQGAAGFRGTTLDVSASGTLNPSVASASGAVANLSNGNATTLFGGKLTASFGSESDGTSFLKLQA